MTAAAALNRAVLLTAPGAAAIAVVRILGPAVPAFLQSHFSRATPVGRCVHGTLSENGRILDDPVAVLLNPHAADLNLHGGPWVVRSTLELLRHNGFEIFTPSANAELSPDALDAATTIDAEIEAWLPLARTRLAVRTLLSQRDAWSRLTSDPNPDAARAVLNDPALHHLLYPPRVAIVGPANVGKSTLANHLFGHDRSIVADLPGTTRDWVGELANLDGLAVTLVDTPGLRDTPDPIEQQAISRSRDQVQSAALVVTVLDATRSLNGEQADILHRHPRSLLVINKTDRPFAEGMSTLPGLRTVASTGQGVDSVRIAILRHFACADLDPTTPRWWTPRQHAWLADHSADDH